MSERDCVHGSLARSCEICELEQERDDYREAVERIEGEVPQVYDGMHLGECPYVLPLHRIGRIADEVLNKHRGQARGSSVGYEEGNSNA